MILRPMSDAVDPRTKHCNGCTALHFYRRLQCPSQNADTCYRSRFLNNCFVVESDAVMVPMWMDY